jgi:seryl-tRNA synthetase
MKYLSEKTKVAYDTVDELEKAEKEFDEKQTAIELKKTERAEAAKKVDEAYAKAIKARKEADELLTEFCKKYGAYHKTYTEPSDDNTKSFLDFISDFPFWF